MGRTQMEAEAATELDLDGRALTNDQLLAEASTEQRALDLVNLLVKVTSETGNGFWPSEVTRIVLIDVLETLAGKLRS